MKNFFRHFIQRICLLYFRLENINPACQNMWNNAGNNLVVPSELKVDAVNNANPLFEVRLAGAGKVRSPEFQRFKGI